MARYYWRESACSACGVPFVGWIDLERPENHLCDAHRPPLRISGIPHSMRSFGGYDRDLGYVASRSEKALLMRERGMIEATESDLPHVEAEKKRREDEKADRFLSRFDDALGRACHAIEMGQDPIPTFSKECQDVVKHD